MAYATTEDLAQALRVRLTPENTALLDACLEAAANEIDGFLDRVDALPDPPPPDVSRANVNRAAEWYKAADAAGGGVGFDQAGVLPARPGDGFARHGTTIRRWRQQWGVS